MVSSRQNKLAVWAVTPNGARLADRLADSLPDADIYVSQNLPGNKPPHILFERLSATLEENASISSSKIFSL